MSRYLDTKKLFFPVPVIKALHLLAQALFFATVLAARTICRARELYVGANSRPHDSKREVWQWDIRLIKDAVFRVVRMGHLAWDSYEPADGKFEFTWFDEVM